MGGGAHPYERRTAAKRIVFGNLQGAVWRGRDGKEKKRTDCVQSDIRTFGIAGDWKASALKYEVWVETVTEVHDRVVERRGRRGQTSSEERDNETGNVAIVHGSVEFCEAAPTGLADESKESLYGRETDRDLRSA